MSVKAKLRPDHVDLEDLLSPGERGSINAEENRSVHPAAAVFPMLDDEALQELASDIKANGLWEPIVVDQDGTVLDGRNRLKACRMAGVEPTFQTFEGEDQEAFILSMNVARRHLTAGQRAMAVAMVYPEPGKGGRGKKNSSAAEGFSAASLSRDRRVLRHSASLAQQVIAGSKSLDMAYAEVKEGERQSANDRSRLQKLREERPDLHEAVVQGRISLDEAEARARADAEEMRRRRSDSTLKVTSGLLPFDQDPSAAKELAADFDAAIAEARGQEVTADRLLRIAAFIAEMAKHWGRPP
jgi:ParB-like chromosome segregation protein Spo0J